MDIHLVARNDSVTEKLMYHLTPLGFSVILWSDPIAFFDQFGELTPEIVIIDAVDFPRHWKPMAWLIRTVQNKDQAVIILLADASLPFDEAAKATHLGINSINNVDLADRNEILRLEAVVKRYREVREQRLSTRLAPDEHDRLGFLCTHPTKFVRVSGELADISVEGASFKPDDEELTSDLGNGTDLHACSLRIGEKVARVDCTVIRNEDTIGLRFTVISEATKELLQTYLDEEAERKLRDATEC